MKKYEIKNIQTQLAFLEEQREYLVKKKRKKK
jgi:hypothetical protein